jgi:mono/diheme cytochrome c family protein
MDRFARAGGRMPHAAVRLAARGRPALALACVAVALACSDAQDEDPVAHGARVYRANCIVCHSPDPSQDGTVGPAIAGASQELLEARVLRGEYPAGYTPKRDSRLMPALPFLASEVPFLVAFLQAPPAAAAAAGR